MSTKKSILITGANGEIGHSLVSVLAEQQDCIIRTVDLRPAPEDIGKKATDTFVGNIIDDALFAELEQYSFDTIYHLAALLSTRSEQNPEEAHFVNVGGTRRVLDLAQKIGKREGKSVKVLFPSSIAVYGMGTLEQKNAAGKVPEDRYCEPITIYGISKLYCEHLGRYFTNHYRMLSPEKEHGFVDFRSLRFPGLISAFTVPSGGTSDYGSEMIHAAAQGKHYDCFVRPDTTIPFMAMPDGVRALLELERADRANLTRCAYNISAFAVSAQEIQDRTLAALPQGSIGYHINEKRQGIVDSWCMDVDDSAAARDWGWKAEYDFARTFDEYLLPNITAFYAK